MFPTGSLLQRTQKTGHLKMRFFAFVVLVAIVLAAGFGALGPAGGVL